MYFNINLAFSCSVFILQAVVEEECMPADQFVEHLLPSLLSLVSDPVPNVRVLLAKALRQTLLEKGVVLDCLRKNYSPADAVCPLPVQFFPAGLVNKRLFGSVSAANRTMQCYLGYCV